MRGAPFTVPAAYGGLDRGNPPDIGPAKIIYQHSNFDFLGHYLSHNPAGINDPKTWVNWKPFLPKFLQQGWGILFLYNAKNQGDVSNQLTEVDARDPVGLGRQHARIAKTLAADLGHESQGAVVFIDNEDHFTTLTAAFRDYITTLIEELGKPGAAPDDPPPLRAGLYVRENPARLILDYSPNVVLWYTDNIAVNGLPYSYSEAGEKGSLITPIGKWPISALKYGTDQKRTALFLGRQWMFYDQGEEDIHVNVGKHGARIKNLDFDTSLVRDPRYPVAQPRIVAWEEIILRTFFSKTDLSMHVERVRGGTSWPTLLQPKAIGDDLLEPEAPLVLVVETNVDQGPDIAGPHPELFTLSKAGLPVGFKAARAQGNPEVWTWSTPTRIVSDSAKLVLRRNRAMTAVKRSPTDTQVFFVSEAHILMGVRHLADDTWTVPMSLAASEPLHWFSNISAVARDDISVDIFYIDRENRIHTAWWPSTSTQPASNPPSAFQEPTPTPWPGSLHQALPLLSTADKASPILPSTSLAAVSSSRDTILVFAIGNDHALYMASFNANSGWAPLSAIGPQPPKTTPPSAPGTDLPAAESADEPLLFPHTQLSALAVSDTAVYVAAITEINVPCIYRLTLAKGDTTWKFQERFQCPNTPPAPVPKGSNPIPENPAQSEGSAAAYKFNPFGDVVLRMQGGTPVLWIAGVTEDKGVVGRSGEKPAVGVNGDAPGLKGRTGGNRGLLFAKVKRDGMVWMLMK
jgi:hypothetical protein